MRALRSASVDGPVGRAAPPQPLREVSMSMPMFDGKPALTAWLRQRLREGQLIVELVPVDPASTAAWSSPP